MAVIATVAVAMLLVGCTDSASVGEAVDVDVKSEAERLSLGGSTTTVAPSDSTDSAGGAKAAISDPPATAPTTTSSAPPPPDAPAISITINGDGGARPQFDPSFARVFAGSQVEWINADSQPRSVVADNGAFNSGPIPPGGRFVFEALTVGLHPYSDGTRPYAVATLDVVPR